MNHIHLDLTAIAQEGSENIERILLKHLSNENNSIIARQAKEKLVEVYATGIFGYCAIEEGSPIKIPNYPDFDKIGNIIKTPDDVNMLIPCLDCHCTYFDIDPKHCVGASLLAVKSDLVGYNTELTAAETAKLILFCFHAFGEHWYEAGGYAGDPYAYYEVMTIPALKDEKKAIAIMKEFAVTPERFEKFITALSNHFLAMNSRNKGFAKVLLSCYQFGKVAFFGEVFEVHTLKNDEKATAFAPKYGMELLDEPFETNII